MTSNTLSLRSLDIPSIHKFGIGFDSLFDELSRVTSLQSNGNYPPYNVVKHSEDRFSIELAVAGFREGDITVTVDKSQLTISGEQKTDLDAPALEYLYRGISARSFARNFTLADHVEVIDAKVVNGILVVDLERKVPEEMKPKTIAITYK